MPTRGEIEQSGHLEALRGTLQEPCHSWTDDLPVCHLSGVGFSTNQIYRVDGIRREEHEFEDRSFHFRADEDTYFYGIFDGHDGCKAADFAVQTLPAEILLDQLKDKETDKEVKDVLQQAFQAVESSFFKSIDNLLAEKENLRLQLQGLSTYEAVQQFPDVVNRLNTVMLEVASGTTAVVALVHKNKLYVANVGDSRALLCQTDKFGNKTICQLSVDHDIHNEDEQLRLSQLGLDIEKIRQGTLLGTQVNTRCIGNYTIKGGYKDFDNLSEANEEPVIAEPEICGVIEIDKKCKFLLLMSDGLYKSVEQATGAKNSNEIIVQMVVEQFAEQSTLNGVAQAVVDKVVRIHHDAFMRGTESSKHCQKRDDITLLVRIFTEPLPHAHNSPTNQFKFQGLPQAWAGQDPSAPKSRLTITTGPGPVSPSNDTLSDIPSIANTVSTDIGRRSETTFTSSGTSSSESVQQTLFQPKNSVSLDEDGRIKPYVNFSDFYAAVEEACKEGLVSEDWIKPCNK